MKKNNRRKVSLLLLSALMAFSINTANVNAIEQAPILVPGDVSSPYTDNTSHINPTLTEYFDDNRGGGIYHIEPNGELNILPDSTSGNITYSNISAVIDLTVTGVSLNGTYQVGDHYTMGRKGGVIFVCANATDPAGKLNIIGNGAYKTIFRDNQSSDGGAIFNKGNTTITNAEFINNQAFRYYADGATFDIINPEVYDMGTVGRGGAITNYDTLSVNDTLFEGNKAGYETDGSFSSFGYGGAIYNGSVQGGILEVNNSEFKDNIATNSGGAIFNTVSGASGKDAIVNINNSDFEGNIANSGGAIYNTCNQTVKDSKITITNSTFTNNTAVKMDGSFEAGDGGAIYNTTAAAHSSEIIIRNSQFTSNGTKTDASGNVLKTRNGGAIYNTGDTLSYTNGKITIENTDFRNNTAQKGGAIYNAQYGSTTIVDSNFVGNTADDVEGVNQGGAIFGAENSTTTVIARNENVTIGQSSTPDTDSITLQNSAILNLNAHTNRNLDIHGKVDRTSRSTSVPTINVNYDNADYTGNVNFNNSVANVNLNIYNGNVATRGTINTTGITVYGGNTTVDNTVSASTITTQGGTIHFTDDRHFGTSESRDAGHVLNNVILDGGTISVQQGVVSNIAMNSFNLKSDTNIKVDVDLENETMDNLSAANIPNAVIDNGTKLNITSMKNVSETPNVDEATIFFTDIQNLTVDRIDSPERLNGTIYQYAVQKKSGQQIGLSGGGREDDVFFHFSKLGPSDNVTPKPIAQLGAFLLFDNIYRQSFANMDMLSILTRDERETLKRYNRYSNMFDDEINTFYRDKRQEDYPSVFVRGFTNLEHVRMDHGPKVSNVTYGTLIGHESGLYELGKGWDANYAVFGAYTGAHQTYNGIGVWQNGGSTGGVFTAYKGDFWAGLTANVGGWAVEAHNDFGHEHFPMLGTGVAMKTGYNWRLFDNKFIIQPSYMMSYTFVYAYSHNNAAGVHIKQDPLHAIEFIPGVKLIANNFRNGWQPYLAVNMTWMTMEGGSFWADSAVFDRYTIKPFVEYGLGVQKHHGERSTGYLQAMVRNGGRTGVALTGGFRYAIGEDILD